MLEVSFDTPVTALVCPITHALSSTVVQWVVFTRVSARMFPRLLKIYDVTHSDHFFFACVSLSDSPRIDPLSPVRALVPGKPLVLNCTARGGPEPTITWHKDRKFVYQGQALVIRNETSSAHGLYTCRASNGIAPDDIASVTVTSLGK